MNNKEVFDASSSQLEGSLTIQPDIFIEEPDRLAYGAYWVDAPHVKGIISDGRHDVELRVTKHHAFDSQKYFGESGAEEPTPVIHADEQQPVDYETVLREEGREDLIPTFRAKMEREKGFQKKLARFNPELDDDFRDDTDLQAFMVKLERMRQAEAVDEGVYNAWKEQTKYLVGQGVRTLDERKDKFERVRVESDKIGLLDPRSRLRRDGVIEIDVESIDVPYPAYILFAKKDLPPNVQRMGALAGVAMYASTHLAERYQGVMVDLKTHRVFDENYHDQIGPAAGIVQRIVDPLRRVVTPNDAFLIRQGQRELTEEWRVLADWMRNTRFVGLGYDTDYAPHGEGLVRTSVTEPLSVLILNAAAVDARLRNQNETVEGDPLVALFADIKSKERTLFEANVLIPSTHLLSEFQALLTARIEKVKTHSERYIRKYAMGIVKEYSANLTAAYNRINDIARKHHLAVGKGDMGVNIRESSQDNGLNNPIVELARLNLLAGYYNPNTGESYLNKPDGTSYRPRKVR